MEFHLMGREVTTPRDRFRAALQRRPLPGLVPHFELEFFLTMEVFGKVHPGHRSYHQWMQMSPGERAAHIDDMARLQVDWCRKYGWSGLLIQGQCTWEDERLFAMIDRIREISGDELFLMIHGDPTPGIPGGSQMEEMALSMAEEPEKWDAGVAKGVDESLARAARIRKRFGNRPGLDGYCLCSDYCFNTGPFLPLDWFDRFVTPHLHRLVRGYKELGFYVIKHTDGNIMPILDRLVPEDEASRPHGLHSLDPQGGVDMAEVVRLVGDKVCLCGNVNCALLQTGTDEECIASARYALEHGMKAPGYIFCTSNCVYTGMDLKRYELILDVWRKEGVRGK